jgi:hypothetical protein
VISVAAMVLAAGCASSKASSVTSAASTASSESSQTSTPASAAPTTGPAVVVDVSTTEFPDTPMTAPLNQVYRNHGLTFDSTSFAIAPGVVTAAWYIVGDSWAVYYRGLTPEAAIGKCPGNSIGGASGFEHVTNSPYGANACQGFTGVVLPPGSLHLCAKKAIVYTSAIPISATGALYGSIEQLLFDASIQGMTSKVTANTAYVPVIDVSHCDVIS